MRGGAAGRRTCAGRSMREPTASTGPSFAVIATIDDREDQPHAEDGDQDADGQEDLLPEAAHPPQDGGVDDRVVEGQRDLEDRQDRDDPSAIFDPPISTGQTRPTTVTANEQPKVRRSKRLPDRA